MTPRLTPEQREVQGGRDAVTLAAVAAKVKRRTNGRVADGLSTATTTARSPGAALSLPADVPRRSRIHTVRLSEVQSEPIDYLSRGRMGLGKLTVIEGDPDVNKSTLSTEIAAALSSGRSLFGEPALARMDVLLVNYEDGMRDTIRPRAEAAGADLTRLHVVNGVGELSDPLVLPDHLDDLRLKIEEKGARVVVIDPLMAAISADVNAYIDQDVRRVLSRFKKLAEETGCAIVVIRHLTKGAHSKATHAGGGSIGITGAARFVLVMAVAPDNPEERILASVKCNVARKPPSLRFKIESVDLSPTIQAPRLVFVAECDLTADMLNAKRSEPAGESTGELEEACAFLTGTLHDGARPSRELYSSAAKEHISASTLFRAFKKLGGSARREGSGAKHRAIWELPRVAPPPSGSLPSTPASCENVAGVGDAGMGREGSDKATHADRLRRNREPEFECVGRCGQRFHTPGLTCKSCRARGVAL